MNDGFDINSSVSRTDPSTSNCMPSLHFPIIQNPSESSELAEESHTNYNSGGSSSGLDQLHYCKHCSYRSFDRVNVKRHMSYDHKDERPFECPICHFRFTLRTNLQRHMLTHTGEKPFECSLCSKKFRTKTPLENSLEQENKMHFFFMKTLFNNRCLGIY
ncbi:Zinc finger and BTB domain-containing protein 22 [Armadillidium nasatum]|uniref:Zinc finger and BTB domain-containing protein 22 n=1 Tax=Armadillidium nasatum TaxID=96803 RepID=A0A5N5T9F8_9CRUS|nr:Zinc finger and BTB domain-containing protein 22 [Armadillidium nasatum]